MTRLFGILTAAALVFPQGGVLAADSPSTEYALAGIRIVVNDIPKSIAFYTKFFGMKEGPKPHPVEQTLVWPTNEQGSGIVLFHDESGRSGIKPGTVSLVIHVPDVEKVVKDLAAAGYKDVGQVTKTSSGRLKALVKDPDGNQLELLTPTHR